MICKGPHGVHLDALGHRRRLHWCGKGTAAAMPAEAAGSSIMGFQQLDSSAFCKSQKQTLLSTGT